MPAAQYDWFWWAAWSLPSDETGDVRTLYGQKHLMPGPRSSSKELPPAPHVLQPQSSPNLSRPPSPPGRRLFRSADYPSDLDQTDVLGNIHTTLNELGATFVTKQEFFTNAIKLAGFPNVAGWVVPFSILGLADIRRHCDRLLE